MINKDKLRETISSIRELNGTLTLGYIPLKTIYSTEALYGLYYSGWNKIEIGKYFSTDEERIHITDDNFEKIVDKVYNLLSDSIGDYINKALSILNMDDTQIKYFDREPDKLKMFQETVLKLKKSKTNPLL